MIIEAWYSENLQRIKKLERNIERDKEVNKVLEADGWKVIRFWEEEINADVARCVSEIKSHLKE